MNTEWEDPRRVLSRHALRPKASFSQNFLVARPIAEAIVDAIAPEPAELIVELGAGVGTLTSMLLHRGAHVIAVERDRDMARVLRDELGARETFELVEGDAASVDLGALASRRGGPVAIAGNLPYGITGLVLRNIMDHARTVARAVLMVQREVRDRLVAKPGTKAYGALTVFAQAAFRIESVKSVPPGAFFPAPKVWSAVVRLVPHATRRAEETQSFRLVVRASFEGRRKTLRNAMLQAFERAQVDAALAKANIDGRRRGETLSVEEFGALAAGLA